MALVEGQDPKTGRFGAGNKGKPKGAKDKVLGVRKAPRAARIAEAIRATAAETVIQAAEPHMKSVIEALVKKAEDGDVGAAAILLRHCAPPVSRRVVRGHDDIASLAPDQRITEIARRVARGTMSAEDGDLLSRLAANEVNVSVVAPLRAAMAALKAGESAVVVLAKLAEAVSVLPVIEGEASRVG